MRQCLSQFTSSQDGLTANLAPISQASRKTTTIKRNTKQITDKNQRKLAQQDVYGREDGSNFNRP